MLRRVVKYVKFFVYAALLAVSVTFAVANRQSVTLTLYPLPFALTLPLFLFAIILLAIGLAIGWSIARLTSATRTSASRSLHRRTDALENELAALRAAPRFHESLPPR